MYGIPVHAWDNRTFENIASLWGDFVRIDGATSAAVSFKRAQALIETDWLCNIDEVINLEVKGDMFEVRVVEIERGAVRFDRDDVLVSESEEIGKRQEEEVQSDKASWRATAVQEGDSRKVQRISEVMFSSCPPKERLIDSQHLAKKLRGRPFDRLGGVLVVWGRGCFTMKESYIGGSFVWLSGRWVQEAWSCEMLGLYAPCNAEGHVTLWNDIRRILQAGGRPWCIIGDFNVVRTIEEQQGMLSLARVQLSLPRGISDHVPLCLVMDETDWGPRPFRFINAWVDDHRNVTRMGDEWDKLSEYFESYELLLDGLDGRVARGEVEGNVAEERQGLTTQLWRFYRLHESLWRQKSRALWLRQRDHNTRFFSIVLHEFKGSRTIFRGAGSFAGRLELSGIVSCSSGYTG
ncbi:hypothetical protein V6N12_034563 [Hibiscus sabdariffa]|uniref:Endonuclease/exonuclease/phosphatase domain-containing protein n=1 Tax=Hibiscus sabdariffa TaxID=183260 RepID=A0ABR2DHI0_9ROSI